MCFIEYKTTFDKLGQKDLFELRRNDAMFKNVIIIIQDRLRSVFSKYIKIERGLRQWCSFSPDLLNLYREAILRFVFGGHNLNSIRYAENTVSLTDRKLR